MRCNNSFDCSGKMIIKCDKNAVWVAAHSLPVFAQCDGCGFAPLPEEQPDVIFSLLKEYIANDGYQRGATYWNDFKK